MKKEKEKKPGAGGKPKVRASSDTGPGPSVVGLTAKVEKDEKDYQRRIKVVEVSVCRAMAD